MNKRPLHSARREFLRHAGAVAALGSAAPLALNLSLISKAAASTATGYKALVCIFMKGGNDAFNTVLATDRDSWAAYSSVRGQGDDSIALAAAGQPGGVIPIRLANPDGRTLALHPSLALLKPLIETQRRLSIVANVGPLAAPTVKSDLGSSTHPLPPRLFSHNDQQNVWLAMAPEGASSGWGGRMGDLLASVNDQATFTAISAGGRPTWNTGRSVQPVSVSSAGSISFGVDPDGSLYGSSAAGAALQRIGVQHRGTSRMGTDYSWVAKRSLDTQAVLAASLPLATDSRWSGTGAPGTRESLQYVSPITGTATVNPLGTQLQTVARLMAAAVSGGLGVRRQVFYVELNGFDTHDDQLAAHAELLAQLAHGIAYFDLVLSRLGLGEAVTVFTASEFGRTFTSNGDGTDHGWGGHHFVLGSALAGGVLHGRFPTLGFKNPEGNKFDSSPDQLHNGVLLPSLAVEQLAAPLGTWMGLSTVQLHEVLPSLRRF